MTMKLTTPDGTEVMQLEGIERNANDVALKVVVMGAMPMTVVLKPGEARKALRMLDWRLWFFLASFLFRR